MEGGKEYKKGLWTEEEDRILMEHVRLHGKGRWNRVAKSTSLKRCGRSCRLRWMNYLSPLVKRGDFSEEEEDLIIRLHKLLGNRWSLISGRVPGRTDNQVKNYWNTYLKKKTFGVTHTKKRLSQKQDHNVRPESTSEHVFNRVGRSDGDEVIDNVGNETTRNGFENPNFWLSSDDGDLHTYGIDSFFVTSDTDFAWASFL